MKEMTADDCNQWIWYAREWLAFGHYKQQHLWSLTFPWGFYFAEIKRDPIYY